MRSSTSIALAAALTCACGGVATTGTGEGDLSGSNKPDSGSQAPVAADGGPSPTTPDQCPAQAPLVQPLQPTSTPEQACSAPAGGSGAFEQMVGRWVPCPGSSLPDPSHAALEVSGTGRWQFLVATAQGYAPSSPSVQGYLETWSDVQLRCWGSGTVCPFPGVLHVSGDRLATDSMSLARIPPGPENGLDIAVPLEIAGCSIVGTWDFTPLDDGFSATPQTIHFDPRGRFVGGPQGIDPCQGFDKWGNVTIVGTTLMLTNMDGAVPSCSIGAYAGFETTVDPSCTTMQLTVWTDNCTGGNLFHSGGTLQKRAGS